MTYIENVFLCMASPLLIAAMCMGKRQRKFFLFCFAGMGACLLSAYINTFFVALYKADTFAATTEIAPVVEEVMKLLPLLFYLLIFEPKAEQIKNAAVITALSFATLGALAARARQLRNQAPGAAARLYTAVDVQDERQLAFYEHNGFKMDYTEDLVRLNDPDEVPQLFNCSCITLPLNTVQEQMDLVSRMRGAGFSYFDHGFLLQQMNRQNFAALGILYGSNLVGACVFSILYGLIVELPAP